MISKKNLMGILFMFILFSSCCKKAFTLEQIRKVRFVNFSINEIDTFYVLPIFKDSLLSFSDYEKYKEND
jgi:hypothetical protein